MISSARDDPTPGNDSNSLAEAVLILTMRERFAGPNKSWIEVCVVVEGCSCAGVVRSCLRVALSHAIAGHGDNRQNEGRNKENESEPENPEGEEAEN